MTLEEFYLSEIKPDFEKNLSKYIEYTPVFLEDSIRVEFSINDLPFIQAVYCFKNDEIYKADFLSYSTGKIVQVGKIFLYSIFVQDMANDDYLYLKEISNIIIELVQSRCKLNKIFSKAKLFGYKKKYYILLDVIGTLVGFNIQLKYFKSDKTNYQIMECVFLDIIKNITDPFLRKINRMASFFNDYDVSAVRYSTDLPWELPESIVSLIYSNCDTFDNSKFYFITAHKDGYIRNMALIISKDGKSYKLITNLSDNNDNYYIVENADGNFLKWLIKD